MLSIKSDKKAETRLLFRTNKWSTGYKTCVLNQVWPICPLAGGQIGLNAPVTRGRDGLRRRHITSAFSKLLPLMQYFTKQRNLVRTHYKS